MFLLKYQVFGGGLFVLPLLTLLGAIWFYRIAHKAHLSNSTTQDYKGTANNTGITPLHSIGQFWFAVILFAATVAIVTAMIMDK